MQARRLEPPLRRGSAAGSPPASPPGRWRTRGRVPTRGPDGVVLWWERPAPDPDLARWEAVQRVQARRLERRLSVSALARECQRMGHPLRRETLSRVLNGAQSTTWDTVEVLAEILDVEIRDLHPAYRGDAARTA